MKLTEERLVKMILEELDAMGEGHGGMRRGQRERDRYSRMSAIRQRGTLNNNELMKKHNATPPEGIDQYYVGNVLTMFKELVKERKPRPGRNKIPENSLEMEVVKAWMGNAIGKIVAAAYVGEEDLATLESELKNIEED
jgi:hypothetical protein